MKHFEAQDGLKLAFADEGEGFPVLCLAGLTRNMADFAPFRAAVSGVRLIRLDTRGRGGSDHDPDPMQGYQLAVETRDAIDLLDHLGIPRAVIVGTSRGGLIAMMIGALAKERLAGVLLNDVGPVLEPAGLDLIKTYVGKRPAARSYAEVGAALAHMNAESFGGVDAAQWADHARGWYVEGPDGLALRYDPALRDVVLAAGEIPDLWPLFHALDGVPLAALRGANSNLLSEETFAAMQAARPDMIAATVPDRGHVPFLNEPEALSAFAQLMERIDEHA